MKRLQSISVFGLGKLGACIAATLAKRGFDVLGVDVDPEKVRLLNEGLPPVEEPLLAETIHEGRTRLRATSNVEEAVATDASFFIPPSPSLPDGSFSNEFLLRAMQPIARCLRAAGKRGHLFVINSTTTPGSVRQVLIPMLERETGGVCGREFGVCYSPEFIALGNVIRGLLEPDLVLIGESDPASGEALAALYRCYNQNQPTIARMSITSAELTKISVNSYITLKISFTNQLQLIAERFPDADIHDILAAVGADSRIGRKYLLPGLSYGGPCLPRDNRLVAFVARQAGLEAPLAEAADRVNEHTKRRLVERVTRMAVPGDTVAVLGVAYKPDTYIVEESAGLYLAQRLMQLGYHVLIHDEVARPASSPSLHAFDFLPSLDQLTTHLSLRVVALCCPSPGYRKLRLPPEVKVFDPWGLLGGTQDLEAKPSPAKP
jgi:UDPglucose 6-dehydrogenase